jgi:hypothetical protein
MSPYGSMNRPHPAPRSQALRQAEGAGGFFFDIGGTTASGAGGHAAAHHGGGHGLRALARKHGLPFAIYYITVTETLAVLLALCLHYDVLGKGDITSVLKLIGIEGWLDVDGTMNKKKEFGPFSVSARLVTNFAFAKACIALLAPIKLPFCVATLPYVMRVFGRVAPRAAAAATGQKAAAAGATAAAAEAATVAAVAKP